MKPTTRVLIAITAAFWGGLVSGCTVTFSKSAQDYYQQGVQDLQQRDYRAAIAALNHAIDLSPNSAELLD